MNLGTVEKKKKKMNRQFTADSFPGMLCLDGDVIPLGWQLCPWPLVFQLPTLHRLSLLGFRHEHPWSCIAFLWTWRLVNSLSRSFTSCSMAQLLSRHSLQKPSFSSLSLCHLLSALWARNVRETYNQFSAKSLRDFAFGLTPPLESLCFRWSLSFNSCYKDVCMYTSEFLLGWQFTLRWLSRRGIIGWKDLEQVFSF